MRRIVGRYRNGPRNGMHWYVVSMHPFLVIQKGGPWVLDGHCIRKPKERSPMGERPRRLGIQVFAFIPLGCGSTHIVVARRNFTVFMVTIGAFVPWMQSKRCSLPIYPRFHISLHSHKKKRINTRTSMVLKSGIFQLMHPSVVGHACIASYISLNVTINDKLFATKLLHYYHVSYLFSSFPHQLDQSHSSLLHGNMSEMLPPG